MCPEDTPTNRMHDCAPRTEVVPTQCHLQEELYESRLKQAACDQALNRSPIAALKVWVVATRLALQRLLPFPLQACQHLVLPPVRQCMPWRSLLD